MKWILFLCLSWCLLSSGQDANPIEGKGKMGKKKGSHLHAPPGASPASSIPVNFTAEYVKYQLDIVEQQLALREMSRMDRLLQTMQKQQIEIHGFYHTSTWRTFWKHVVSEQLYILDGKRKFPQKKKKTGKTAADGSPEEIFIPDYASYEWEDHFQPNHAYTSLLNISTGLYLNIAGPTKDDYKKMEDMIASLKLKNRHKIQLNYNQTIGRNVYHSAKGEEKARLDANMELSDGEFSTIQKLHAYCKQKSLVEKKKAIVFYMHSKGSCCQKEAGQDYTIQNPVAAWREYMNTMNLEFPSICLRAIVGKKYLTCGVENQDAHYSGNYWWADCDHVALLPPIPSRFEYTAAEFFILNFHDDFHVKKQLGFRCGYSIHNCGLNLYDNECSRERFRDRLIKSVMYKLMPNNVYPKEDHLARCRDFVGQKKLYRQAADEVRKILN
jgi:hypothetical protein